MNDSDLSRRDVQRVVAVVQAAIEELDERLASLDGVPSANLAGVRRLAWNLLGDVECALGLADTDEDL